ncbi:MAG: hypothetical protein KAS32_06740 [Candidatus Peribacteraceae bacterium]|nr:hypothetical protein [Candidatus Peribacteraceae bacterium]
MSNDLDYGSDLDRHIFGIDYTNAISRMSENMATQIDTEIMSQLSAASAVPLDLISGTQTQNTASEIASRHNREANMNVDYRSNDATTTYTTEATLNAWQYATADYNNDIINKKIYIEPNPYSIGIEPNPKKIIDKLGSLDENEALALLDMLSAQNFHRHDCPAAGDDMLECECDWKPYKDLMIDFVENVLEDRD